MADQSAALVSRRKRAPEIYLWRRLVDQLAAVSESAASRDEFPYEWRKTGNPSGKSTNPLLVVWDLDDVDATALTWLRELRRPRKKILMLTGGVPVQALSERLARLDIRDPQRLHIAYAPHKEDRERLLRRLLFTLSTKSTSGLILDAWWENDDLVVLSPTFERIRIPLVILGKVTGRSDVARKEWKRFSVHRNGAHIAWPTLDIHMGWDQFAQAVDPQRRLQALQESAKFNARYGRAIRMLRENHGLRQSDIDGITERHVRRIEHGEQPATLEALRSLAQAHGMELKDYLAALAELSAPGRQPGPSGRKRV